MNCFTEEQVSRINNLINEIEKLSDVEKLFLYLQLPCGSLEVDESGNKAKLDNTNARAFTLNNRSNFSDLFSKKPDQETTQTYTWILSHLEVDPNVSLPKQEVYDEYRAFCQANSFEPLCVADFGKAMKHAFPCIKPRRLGQRGNSRYCYSGLRKKYRLQAPSLPDVVADNQQIDDIPVESVHMSLPSQHLATRTNTCASFAPMPEGQRQGAMNNIQPSQQEYNTGYEVMNLKVEATQELMNGSRSFYSSLGAFTDPSYNLSNGAPTSGRQSPKQNLQAQHNLHAYGQSILVASSACMTTNSSATADSHLANVPSRPEQLCLAQTKQTNLDLQHTDGSITGCGYGSQLHSANVQPHPARSPDDDDYQHNYQDMLPALHRMSSFDENRACQDKLGVSGPHGGSMGIVYARHSAVLTQNLSQHPQGHPGTGVKSAHPTITNHQFALSTNLNQNLPPQPVNSVTTSHLTADQQQSAHVGQLALSVNDNPQNCITSGFGGSHMDSCASPFQSPASTPYPGNTAGGFISHDLIDYYSDDCLRYQN